MLGMRKRKWIILALCIVMTFGMSSTAQAKNHHSSGNGGGKQSVVLATAPYGGSRVVSYNQGLRYNGEPVIETRSNPNAVLTYEEGKDEANFYSLGFRLYQDGWIIIEFQYPIQNGPGNDISVVEDTWGLPYPRESAKVYVSNDRRYWKYIGEADNQNPVSSWHTISSFDLSKACMKEARYVKLVDSSIREEFAGYSPVDDMTLDAYDVNVVLALHDYVKETDCHSYTKNCWNWNWSWNKCSWAKSSFCNLFSWSYFKGCKW